MHQSMHPRHTISTRNLRALAWKSGYQGVSDLARTIGRSRQTLYAAVKNPTRHGPTLRLIRASLRK